MIGWDAEKRLANMRKHGLDLADAADFEFDTALVEEDSDAEGEQRFRAIGFVPGFASWFLPSAARTSARSACVPRLPRRAAASMRTRTETLTLDELAEIKKRRAAAKERARRLPPLSEAEDAAIIAGAMTDPDARPMTEAQLARLRPAHAVVPGLVAEVLRRPRGRPKLERPKEQITIRLDQDVVEHYRKSGPGWQTRVNEVLRKAAKAER